MKWWLSYSNKKGPIGVVISQGESFGAAVWSAAKSAPPDYGEVLGYELVGPTAEDYTDSDREIDSWPLHTLIPTATLMQRGDMITVPSTTVHQLVKGTYRGPT